MAGSAANVIVSAFTYYFPSFRAASTRYGTERKKSISQHEYSQRYANIPKKKDRGPGIIATILPFYAFGIFVYFVYIIVKLLNKRRKVNPKEKADHLKDYYRNFRYVPEKEKFKMDSDSSGDEHGIGPPCNIGWSLPLGVSNAAPDVYRSVAGLPKDLEYLLKKADQDNLDDMEITRLRTRLEQMESEMTRLLEAVNRVKESRRWCNAPALTATTARLSSRLKKIRRDGSASGVISSSFDGAYCQPAAKNT
ncbi:hypothetical protein TcWFU_001172 [Taenia crassiceps]|uniref:Resistance to inhibitors of cholinesterase protein 3 N-terminal domain-containing protein n=1 Tax=Taenia crassiceps TaxID=6207 RepID=A0ABR4QIY7_9CEST